MTTKTKGKAEDEDVYAGEMLLRARRRNKMTQEQLAQAVGVTFQQIQKYEKGINRISVSRLKKFCIILNVPPHTFFEDFENQATEVLEERVRFLERKLNNRNAVIEEIRQTVKGVQTA